MFRRVCFAISACGMLFVLMPFTTLVRRSDFTLLVVGFAFIILGVFCALESVYKTNSQNK